MDNYFEKEKERLLIKYNKRRIKEVLEHIETELAEFEKKRKESTKS